MDPGTYIYTSEQGLMDMEKSGMSLQVIRTFDDFNVTRLNIQFLNPATREEAISKTHLVRMTMSHP